MRSKARRFRNRERFENASCFRLEGLDPPHEHSPIGRDTSKHPGREFGGTTPSPGTSERATDIVTSSPDAPPAVATAYESPTEPPTYVLRDLARISPFALGSIPDPPPALRGVTQEIVTDELKGGDSLSATLHSPANHRDGFRLPLVVQACPVEYTDPPPRDRSRARPGDSCACAAPRSSTSPRGATP